MFLAPGGVGSHTISKTGPAEMEVYNFQRTSEDFCPELVMVYSSEPKMKVPWPLLLSFSMVVHAAANSIPMA